MSDPAREAFEAWFAATYGPPPSDAQIMASLAEAARLEAFMGGAWAAWQHLTAVAVEQVINDDVEDGMVYDTPPPETYRSDGDPASMVGLGDFIPSTSP